MQHPVSAPSGVTAPNHADRIGFAQLTRRAFEGGDLHPLRDRLLRGSRKGRREAGEGLDLSLIAQLLGDKEAGLVIQTEVLSFHQLFRTPCAAPKPRLRVLALAADIDMGGNTPIEFLLEDSDIELLTLYVIKGIGLPETLPDHDVAIVIASDSEECREALALIEKAAPRWPRPLLNRPRSHRQSRSRQAVSAAGGHPWSRHSRDHPRDARAIVGSRRRAGSLARTSRANCAFR